jgi:chemotaxis protein MotB
MPRRDTRNITIIKREEVIEAGHHGGAWKVAYADFVTAMMAFFLLMWLLNATTEVQRRGLADYFSVPALASRWAANPRSRKVRPSPIAAPSP